MTKDTLFSCKYLGLIYDISTGDTMIKVQKLRLVKALLTNRL